jgi:hypothetical protein
MLIPTVKLMIDRGFTADQATKIRALMENYRGRYPCGERYPRITLEKISDVIEGFGCERIPKGHNSKSPAIAYANMGDPYHLTIMWYNYISMSVVGAILWSGATTTKTPA